MSINVNEINFARERVYEAYNSSSSAPYAKENGFKQQTFAKWVKAEKFEESGCFDAYGSLTNVYKMY